MKLLVCKQNTTQWLNDLLFYVSEFRNSFNHRLYLRLQRKCEASVGQRNYGRGLNVERKYATWRSQKCTGHYL